MQLRKDDDFRETIAATIFACGEEGAWRYQLLDTLRSNAPNTQPQNK
jgi:hypothetical protein